MLEEGGGEGEDEEGLIHEIREAGGKRGRGGKILFFFLFLIEYLIFFAKIFLI